MSKTSKVIVGLVVVLLAGGAGTYAVMQHHTKDATPTTTKSTTPEVRKMTSKITSQSISKTSTSVKKTTEPKHAPNEKNAARTNGDSARKVKEYYQTIGQDNEHLVYNQFLSQDGKTYNVSVVDRKRVAKSGKETGEQLHVDAKGNIILVK